MTNIISVVAMLQAAVSLLTGMQGSNVTPEVRLQVLEFSAQAVTLANNTLIEMSKKVAKEAPITPPSVAEVPPVVIPQIQSLGSNPIETPASKYKGEQIGKAVPEIPIEFKVTTTDSNKPVKELNKVSANFTDQYFIRYGSEDGIYKIGFHGLGYAGTEASATTPPKIFVEIGGETVTIPVVLK